MLNSILLGSILIVATGLVHTLLSGIVVKYVHNKIIVTPHHSIYKAVFQINFIILLTVAATIIEAVMWAVCYIQVGALSNLEEALYFSIITYTTLGYGDITLQPDWRLLSSFEAASGIIMFGWSTSLVVLMVSNIHFGKARKKSESKK